MWLSAVESDPRAQAHSLLRRTVAQVLGVSPAEVRITREPAGRPRVAGGLHVSVSHSAGHVAVAVTRAGPIGVDVESIRPLPALKLARRWFTEQETRWLGRFDRADRHEAFFWLWTHKEAMGKARGTGLSGGGLHRRVPLPPIWPPPGDRLELRPVAEPQLVAGATARSGLVLAVAAEKVPVTPAVTVHQVG